jgi:MerR family transcriptional regulator/heat shock protein HspR
VVEYTSPDEPCYVISVAAQLVDLHPQTLRYYERIGLVVPARSPGNMRLYSQNDIERIRKICRLTDDLGVNLAGVDVILRLTETLEQMQAEIEEMHAALDQQVPRLRHANEPDHPNDAERDQSSAKNKPRDKEEHLDQRK